MKENVTLLDLFPEADLGEVNALLQQNIVENVDLRVKEREVAVVLRSEVYLPLPLLAKAEQQICTVYDLRRVTLEPRYEPALLANMDYADVTGLLSGFYPPAPATLAGCRWEAEGATLHVHLRGNGLADLKPHLRHAEEWLSACFGTPIRVELHGGRELTAEELFAETERIRAEAQASCPAAEPAAPAEPAAKAQPTADGTIFGKPIFQDPIPMRELNVDMFKVCVEGEVFAVNHKELPKAKAWVVSFYMTDHTGSVCVNQYMEEGKARPILDAIHEPNPKKHKPGSYVRVYGKVTVSRYDNELVLQPFSIQEAKRPVRKDNAPEKRVELHLHTKMSAMDAVTNTADAILQAAKWGHRAVAITDHGVAHSFTDALANSKTNIAGTEEPIKILYGCEGYFINDVDTDATPESAKTYRNCVFGDRDGPLNGEFIAFDVEATGLSAEQDRLIEIGAARMRGDQILEKFNTFVDP